ncbi:uridine diphosphate-N-acetylglucosamine-binding protein YvcK [Fodinibacter luteus]|uniref:Putative gluconeogenesis factor n=1 Tax=Fodinibacter luteus TaxID=552064 RepID=A0ABP8K8N3_9MICO
MTGPVVAALGGGHGLAATLTALRYVTDELTAIVTVADDGGSSGRLREEFGVLPPGDLRMALAALCSESEWGHTWRDVLQHRFAGDGPLGGHALGNLLIIALWELHDDPVAGLDLVARLLQAQGRVLPMAAVPLTIEADVSGLDPADPDAVRVVRGQATVAVTPGTVETVRLVPADPPAYPESVAAIRSADWVVLGPGSWFTSVMTHLLVPEVREALEVTRARRLLVLNLDPGTGETAGFSAERHLETFAALAPRLRLDAVLADPAVVDDAEHLAEHCTRLGASLFVATVGRRDRPGEHDPLRFAAALRDIVTTSRPAP